MSDSTWNDPRITAYVLGELSPEEQTEFEIELEKNPELAAAVEEARNVTGQLQDLYAAESTPPLDAERRQAITPARDESASRSWKLPLVGLATAATLLLIAGSAMIPRAREASGTKVAGEIDRIAADQELSEYGRATAQTEQLQQYGSQAAPEEFNRAMPPASESKDASADTGSRPLEVSGPDAADLAVDVAAPAVKEAEGKSNRKEIGGRNRATAASQPSSRPLPNQFDAANAPRQKSESLGRVMVESARANRLQVRLGAEFQTDDRSRLGAGRQGPAGVRELLRQGQNGEPIPNGGVGGGGGFGDADDEGRGPGIPGDRFDPITDNPFRRVGEHPLSTFSVDVDTASYSKVRDFLLRSNQLPRPDAVRIEEMVNYFDYAYDPPAAIAEHPFTAHAAVTSCPWNDDHRLARIALKGKEINQEERPPCNLVFLLDTSGSMNAPNKLPLVIDGMKMLLKQLNQKDRVAVTVYAGSAGLVLDSTPAKKKKKIRKALTRLSAGGSTNGGAGIQLAYQTARDHFIEGGVNRVILCTDGDFNVGTTGTDALVRMVEQEAKGGIFLTVLGFGMGNHNDAMLEQISGRGNGNYAFIDTDKEARKVLVEQAAGTLVTIAKDVKLQVEFNPSQVSAYRLIGYENRVLAKEDFNDDKKDAGEIGAGHQVTALYEIVPAGVEADAVRPKVDDLKYQAGAKLTDAAASGELMTLKLRYKQPDGDTSTLVQFPVTDDGRVFADADEDVRFAAAVAGFGMQLRRSEYKGSWTLSNVREVAQSARGEDPHGLRSEFLQLVRRASDLMGAE